MLNHTTIDSPVGPLSLAADDQGLRRVAFGPGPDSQTSTILHETVRQLRAYFAGELREFSLPLSPQGTAFQTRVWRELCKIPYGQTISYGELARRIGNPKASRAVGLANGQNPIAIVIPCHRVIGANGKLTGYGGGLAIKERLLALEAQAARLRTHCRVPARFAP